MQASPSGAQLRPSTSFPSRNAGEHLFHERTAVVSFQLSDRPERPHQTPQRRERSAARTAAALVFYLIVSARGLVATLATRFEPRVQAEPAMRLGKAA